MTAERQLPRAKLVPRTPSRSCPPVTTVESPPAPPTAIRPRVVARTGLYAVLAANAAVVACFFAQAGFASNALIVIGRLAGLYGALIMAFQLVLVARLPWLDRRIGMDRLTAWHRWTGFALLWTVVAHAALVVLGYMVLAAEPVWRAVLALALDPASLLGMIAATLLVVVAAVSVRRARRRLTYETWHALHLLPYLVVGLGLVHQLLDGTTFPAALTPAAGYWWTLWAIVIGALLVGRLG